MQGDNKTMNRLTFVNPYTFVPYDRKKKTEKKQEGIKQEEKQVTGYLDCLLTVKTPLAIPDVEQSEPFKDSDYYHFFSVEVNGENQYRIPGSSIRGMLRNVYETVTNSCFSTMREDTGLSKRSGVNEGYQAGLLIKDKDTGKWKLYQAKKFLIPYAKEENKWRYLKDNGITPEYKCSVSAEERILISTRVKSKIIHYGDPVEFKPVQGIPLYKSKGYSVWAGIVKTLELYEDVKREPNAYAFVGEYFSRKHGEEVFVKGNPVQEKDFSSDQICTALELLKESLEMYRMESINKEYKKTHCGYAGFERAEQNGVIPLWYSVKTKKFSLAYAGRTAYKTTLNDLVGQHAPCVSRKKCCKACDLFGMVGNSMEALGSKIRITDGEFVAKKMDMIEKVTLKELAMPRNSYMNFYSIGQQSKAGIVPANSYDDKGVDIRGRKFYWHHGLNEKGELEERDYRASKEDLNEKNKRKRLHTFDLMKTGAFKFRIYYDGITDTQLSELMWCITLGENKTDSHRWHKIGHGKPLGLGSCKLTIDKRVNRSYQENGYFLEEETNPECLNGEVKETGKWKDALLKVCNAKTVENQTVCYPYIQKPKNFEGGSNDTASHRWFKKFKDVKGALPYIMDGNQTLPVYTTKDIGVYNKKRSAANKKNGKKN